MNEYVIIIGFIILVLFVLTNRKGKLNIKVNKTGLYKVTIINLKTYEKKLICKRLGFRFVTFSIYRLFKKDHSYDKFLIILESKDTFGHVIYNYHRDDASKALYLDIDVNDQVKRSKLWVSY